jgi:hypothetical protein
MKHISFTTEYTQPTLSQELCVRSNREDLIRQIVENTDATEPKKLARRIAIVANTFHWSDMDLHALLKKKGEVNNFSKFVNWTLKTRTVDTFQ